MCVRKGRLEIIFELSSVTYETLIIVTSAQIDLFLTRMIIKLLLSLSQPWFINLKKKNDRKQEINEASHKVYMYVWENWITLVVYCAAIRLYYFSKRIDFCRCLMRVYVCIRIWNVFRSLFQSSSLSLDKSIDLTENEQQYHRKFLFRFLIYKPLPITVIHQKQISL